MSSPPQEPAQEPLETGGASNVTLSSIELQSASWRWEYLPSYRLLQLDVETYLIQVFGEYSFDIHLSGDNWVFWVPRALSDDERSTLLSRRYLRRFNRPRQEPAPPAFANPSIQHNHIPRTISPVARLGAPSLERCRACEIILISWFLVAVVSFATGLWRSFATGDEGKGFTDAAWVVAAGSVVLLAVQKIHDRRCKLVRLGMD